MRGRSALDRLRSDKEALGTLANDQLAEHLLTRICSPDRVFLDVGAHIGSIVAEVRHHCPRSRIVAVEAIPEKAERLRAKFPGVEVFCCALGETAGETRFFINLDRSGYSSLGRSEGRLREIRVPMETLDGLLAEADIDIIKIDVEGAELGVLKGGEQLVAKSRPAIMFESGPIEILGYSKDALWSWFSERSYGILVPNRVAHTAPPLTLEGFIESHSYPRRTTNYFAIPLDRTEEIRTRARKILGITERVPERHG